MKLWYLFWILLPLVVGALILWGTAFWDYLVNKWREKEWVCLNCKYRDNKGNCQCPKMYDRLPPKNDLRIYCSPSFSKCRFKEIE